MTDCAKRKTCWKIVGNPYEWQNPCPCRDYESGEFAVVEAERTEEAYKKGFSDGYVAGVNSIIEEIRGEIEVVEE